MPEHYSDPLVVITDDGIRVRNTSLFRDDKTIPWSDIEKVRAVLPTVWNGRWKIWGTADFRTWMASDWDRPGRETIFIMHHQGKWARTGFTVHDAKRVKQVLSRLGKLVDEQGDALPKPLPQENRPLWQWGSFQATAALLVALIAYMGYYYPQLPQQVATHFNGSGNADGWGHKSVLVTVIIFAGCIVGGLFMVISYAIAKTAAAIMGRYMLWIGAATVAMLLVLAHLSVRANLSPTPSMGYAPLWLMAIYFACLGGIFTVMFRRLA